MQSLVENLDVDTQDYRPALVFFDAAYWGIFSVQEREDKYYAENNHPEIDPDNIDLVEQTAWNGVEVQEGDIDRLQCPARLSTDTRYDHPEQL